MMKYWILFRIQFATTYNRDGLFVYIMLIRESPESFFLYSACFFKVVFLSSKQVFEIIFNQFYCR